MTKRERMLFDFSVVISAALCVPKRACAMHIMEGYLPPAYCIVWGAVCIPFLAAGVIAIRHLVEEKRRSLLILAMAGAFVFVISSLKIPSVTGSCSHMTGTGLAAILFGVPATAILGIIVLIFQAILLAHGGLTTLGANTFSMAIAGPIVSVLLYKLLRKTKLSQNICVFAAAFLGDLFTYCVTSVQLALAYPSPTGGIAASALEFLGVFAPTQLPLAVIEGLLTMVIVIGLQTYAKPELREIGFLNGDA